MPGADPLHASTLELYPALADLQPAFDAQPSGQCCVRLEAGARIFDENTPCRGFPLLLEGEIRVARSSVDGRTIELYRIVPGEICLVSSAALFQRQLMSGHAVATRDSTLRLVEPGHFDRWLANEAFRNSVLGQFADRMSDLTALVDAVAFAKLDQRLAAALLGHGPELFITHQKLADSLGCVREMVTRLLRRFEREGWVSLSREKITLLNSAALRSLSEPSSSNSGTGSGSGSGSGSGNVK